jgi:cobalamin 5'-phosphate synthase/cobalamin synthase
MLRAPLLAFSLLTIIPVPRLAIATALPHGGAVAFFPVVALVLGGAVAAFDAVLSLVLPAQVVSALDLALLAAITGGLHLDGVADTADGVASMPDRAAAIAALRDSRVGALGAAALVFVVLIQWSALASLADGRAAALVCALVLSRWAMVLAIRVYPRARTEGLAAMTANGARRGDGVVASAIAGAVVGVAALSPALLVVVAAAGCAAIAAVAVRRFGGLTGDVYGAIAEVVFAFGLVASSALVG